MKKTWIYKRKKINGWWCGWYENGKLKAKALTTKTLAEHYSNAKYMQLNSDVFTSIVDFNWKEMIDEYHYYKQLKGLVDEPIYEVLWTLQHFKRLVKPDSSRQVTQQALDTFVLERSKEVTGDIKTCNCAFSQSGGKAHLLP